MLAINKAPLTRMLSASRVLNMHSQRSFSNIESPLKKMQFIDHPRYGSVYPIVTID